MNIKQRDFLTALKFVSHAMAKGDIRYYLNAVLMSISEKGVATLVATDGHRMATIDLQLGGSHSIGEFLLCRSGIVTLLKNFKSPKNCEIELTINVDDVVTFENGAQSQTVDLVDGKFPDWKRVVPLKPKKGAALEWGCNAVYLAEAFKASQLIANPRYNGVLLHQNESNSAMKVEVPTSHGEFSDIVSTGIVVIMPMRL